MSLLLTAIGIALVVFGTVFMLLGSIGLIRLPDFFTRTHAASKVDTVGVMMVLLGVACLQGWDLTAAKFVLAAGFLMLTNPAGAHALARVARKQGMPIWTVSKVEPTQEENNK